MTMAIDPRHTPNQSMYETRYPRKKTVGFVKARKSAITLATPPMTSDRLWMTLMIGEVARSSCASGNVLIPSLLSPLSLDSASFAAKSAAKSHPCLVPRTQEPSKEYSAPWGHQPRWRFGSTAAPECRPQYTSDRAQRSARNSPAWF